MTKEENSGIMKKKAGGFENERVSYYVVFGRIWRTQIYEKTISNRRYLFMHIGSIWHWLVDRYRYSTFKGSKGRNSGK